MTRKEKIPTDILRRMYVVEKRSSSEIGKMWGCSESVVLNRLRENNIQRRVRKLNIPPNDLYRMYVLEKKSVLQISKKYNCGTHGVYNHLRKNNVPLRQRGNESRLEIPKEALHKMHIVNHKSIRKIAEELGHDARTVRRHMVEHDVQIRQQTTTRRAEISRDTLHRLYVVDKKSSAQIAEQFGCSLETILNRLRQHGIPVRSPRLHRTLTKDVLHRMYVVEGKTARQIAKELDCGVAGVYAYLRKHGINTLRDHSLERSAELKSIRTKAEEKKHEMRNLFKNKCGICHIQADNLAIHHMCYMPDDVIYANYKRTPPKYYLDLAPIVRKEPWRFMLLCSGCHMMIGKMEKKSSKTISRLVDIARKMAKMCSMHTTKYDNLIAVKRNVSKSDVR